MGVEIPLALMFWLSHKNDQSFPYLAKAALTGLKPKFEIVFL
jgi:hypothetical protein